ncbi:MAG: type II toxin-antitoxin system RelB/DinJ family antitoxin [Campylobacteraceae bacterium]|nr:type II toxin-antitoxin system RelB/DinJ family antitoxin [Campylobacteraceae bacterium]
MTTSVNFKMDKELKEEFAELLKSLGMDMTTAFNIYARAVVRERGIPFEIKENIAAKRLSDAKDENELREILEARVREIENGTVKTYTMDEFKEKMAEKGYEW